MVELITAIISHMNHNIGLFHGINPMLWFMYRGSPTSTVSTSTNSTSTNFSAIGIKLVLVELLCSKISTSGN